jgi:hypothetical protein
MLLARTTAQAASVNNRSVARVVAKVIYVDSLNGNDNNDGLSKDSPIQTLAKLNTLLVTNTVAYLKKNQTYRGTIYIDRINGCVIDSYGEGKHPTLEGTELVPKANFVLTSGQTKTYQSAWDFIDSTITNCTEMGARVWEVLGKVETALTERTNIAGVETNPGSYFSDLNNKIIYVHPSDSSNPTTNSFLYEACKYPGGVHAVTNRNSGSRDHIVRNIRVKRHGANNGGIVLGQESAIYNCVVEWGGKHHALLGSGIIEKLYLYKGKAAQNPLVLYCPIDFVGGTQSVFCREVKIIDVDNATGAAIYCHLGTGGQYRVVQFDNCAVVRPGKTAGSNWGGSFQSQKVILNNCLSVGGAVGVGIDLNPSLVEINGCEFIGGTQAVQRYGNNAYTYDLKIRNTVFNARSSTYTVNVNLDIQNCVFYNGKAVTTPSNAIPSLVFKRNIVTRNGNNPVLDFWNAYPLAISSNENLYSLVDGGFNSDLWSRLKFAASIPLPTWRAEQGQDANTIIESPIKWSGSPASRQYGLASTSAGVKFGAGLLANFSQLYPGLSAIDIEAAIKAEADAL